MTTLRHPQTGHRSSQRGFSLMELLIALMIIGVIATLGMKGYQKYADQARYRQAQDRLRNVAMGLDQYYMTNGKYPDFTSWEQMIDASSPLVQKNLIQVNIPKDDGWGQPFEGKAGKGDYELKMAGDPNAQDDRPPVTWKPGQGAMEQRGGASGGSKDKGGDAAPAPGAGK